ncbi:MULTISPECIES: hypothetical protein [Thermoanaerobacter]|jgi:hypothetical protein|uniref:Uncharacterized protein n=1 Tax=Thermoanaerobacter italicus (strain DSM 9252 / Ab9) TaxID=580331 RepID=D3T7Z9_THEIA|nr:MULTISPECIES: hypothetical protein [Thermoanaerobacter]ADD02081.1 conserved hypothetical protein [Thermoanaerobacter italicus Ab9]
MNKIYVIVIVITIIIAVIVGGIVRASFVDTQKISLDDLMEYKVMGGPWFYEKNFSFSDLVEDSEVIVKGTALEREFLHLSTLVGFRVVSVYKGNDSLKNKTIYIFEPSFFNFKNKFFIIHNGYNFMKYGDEYILFLKKWPYLEYMKYNPFYKNKDIYMLTHNGGIDKYNTNNVFFDKILSSEQEYYYREIEEYEVIAYSKDELNRYNEIKKQILEKFLNINK